MSAFGTAFGVLAALVLTAWIWGADYDNRTQLLLMTQIPQRSRVVLAKSCAEGLCIIALVVACSLGSVAFSIVRPVHITAVSATPFGELLLPALHQMSVSVLPVLVICCIGAAATVLMRGSLGGLGLLGAVLAADAVAASTFGFLTRLTLTYAVFFLNSGAGGGRRLSVLMPTNWLHNFPSHRAAAEPEMVVLLGLVAVGSIALLTVRTNRQNLL